MINYYCYLYGTGCSYSDHTILINNEPVGKIDRLDHNSSEKSNS